MASIGSLALKLSASTGGLKTDLAEGAREVGGFAEKAQALLGRVGTDLGKAAGGKNPLSLLGEGVKDAIGLIPGVGTALTAAVGVGEAALEKLSGKWVQILDVRKQAVRAGTSVEEMGRILAGAGDEADAVGHAFFHFSHILGEAKQGSDEAKKAFAALHLDADKLGKLPIADAFREVRDAISGVEDPTLRASAAQSIFKKSSFELMETLSKSSGEFDRLGKNAEAVGQIVTTEEAGLIKGMKKDWGGFGKWWEGLWTRLSVDVAKAHAGWKMLLTGEAPQGVRQGKNRPDPLLNAAGPSADALERLDQALKDLDGQQTPFQRWADQMANLTDLFDQGLITAREFDQLFKQATDKATGQLVDKTRTPYEKLWLQVQELNKAYDQGLISEARYLGGLGQIGEGLDKAAAAANRYEGTAAALAGSQAALSTVNFTNRLRDQGTERREVSPERIVSKLEELRQQHVQVVQNGREMLAALREQKKTPPTKVVFPY